jgi:hypothetical protein
MTPDKMPALPVAAMRGGKVTHGGWKHHRGTYNSWRGMIARCSAATHPHFDRYGGAGIKVCQRWTDFASFLTDMGERPEEMTLDRIDGTGNYEPANCRWATRAEQASNRKSNSYIEHNGLRLTIKEWSERLNMSANAISKRHKAGRPIDLVLRNRKRADPKPRTKKVTEAPDGR